MNKPNIAYVRLTDEQAAGLDVVTKTEPGNKSDHIRQALDEYLRRKLTVGKEAAEVGVRDGE